ncbi:amino acid adenylation domain-containing protein [Streptomyces sp. NPDC028635]|uniref:amino acid adenylation domain-containing protein n=1 Tax=Streptomyces sp. NPDC028635 TaxID=3154800 RepID=UPI0033D6F996
MPQTDPAARYEPFGLTEVQESFYVGRTLGGGTGAGTQIHLEFETDGLDAERAQAAWNDVVAATDMLRAHLLPDGRQAVRREVPRYDIVTADLTALPPAEADARLERLREEALSGFDPHRWPLFAVRVAQLPGGRSRVLFTVDELIADGPSVSLLLQQWYAAYAHGEVPRPPGISFREYTAATATAEVPDASLAYWREQLAGLDLERPLPLAAARPDSAAPAHRRLTLRLEPDRWERVKAVASKARATPTALLLALCTAVVQAGDSEPLPVVLTTYNRRPVHPEVARLVGPFISTSVFVAPPCEGTLQARVEQVRGRLWQDLEHAAVSGVRALREYARERSDRRRRAVPTVFTSLLGSLAALPSAAADDDAHWAAHVDLAGSATLTSGVQLEICVQERAGALLVSWDFAPAVLDASRTEAAFEALRALLEEIARDGDRALAGPLPSGARPVPPVDPAEAVPLTEVQSAYLVGRVGGLGGEAETRVYQEFLLERHDLDRLERCWNRLVAHHPVLRAAVHENGTLTVAAPADTPPYRIARHDLTGGRETEAELAAVAARMRARTFPLGTRPMYALEASTLPDGTAVLHVLLDALLADARSFALLFGQLFALHDGDDGVLTGSADPLPHLRGLAERKRGEASEQARAAWREKFAALPSGPGLPEPAPGAPRVHRSAALGSWRALTDRAAQIGVPADMVLLTAYTDELRAEYGGQGPFTVTVVSWDRPADLPGAAGMVADFTQLAWVVVDDGLPADFAPRARELWARVRADLERAQRCPGLTELRTRVFRSGGALRLPVVFTRVPEIDPRLHPSGVRLRTSQSQTAQVALDHVPLLVGDDLRGQWDAADGAVEPARLDTMFDRYARRVRDVLAGTGQLMHDAVPARDDATPTHDGAAEGRPAEVRAADARPAEVRATDAGVAAARPAGARPAEDRPADSRAVESRPGEGRSAYAGVVEARPADVRPAGGLPVDHDHDHDHGHDAAGVGSGSGAGDRAAEGRGAAVTLASLVEAGLAGRGDRPAVRFAGRTVTYRELADRTARLAHHLHAVGVRPGDHVAVHMDRSDDLVAALVAIVRAGAVYVPVDPANPPERVRYLLRDSGARVVVADAARAAVPAGTGALVVCPDRAEDWRALAAYPTTPPAPAVGPDDPAYTIYTSGTTGKPKGCRNTQQGVANRLLWMQERFPLGPSDRVAQKTPYGFDVSVWEFFWPVVAGACVVVARPGGHTDPGYLARWLREESVTVTHFVPSVLSMFLRHPAASGCDALRYVFASGEALPVAAMRHFYEVYGTGRGAPELHNLYGPTEAAVDVTHWACRPDWDEPTVPIGRPVAHTSIHLVDEALRPVPPGTPGEIVIGGRQVALGYHARPELTAERFVPSPFPELDPSPRLYRTGDLGQLGEDGEIRYLGRIDSQFKLRGLRIEPEEIEAALTTLPAVAEARVLPVREEPSGEQALAAVCVAREGEPVPGVAELRRALGEVLPPYLVPSRFHFVDRLPLTTNGKLDRAAAAALFTPEAVRDTPGAVREEAVSDAGKEASLGHAPAIRAAVAEVLGVADAAGLDENADLFDLGATSFSMIRIAQEIERITGTALPVDALITHPTLGALTAAAAPATAGPPAEPSAASAPSDAPAPHGSGRLTAADVARTAARILNLTEVDPDADLFDLGATSFSMIRLAQEIEAATGRPVPVDVLVQTPTPRAVAESLTPDPAAAPGPAPAGATDVRIALDPAAKAAFKEAKIAERRLPATLARVPVPAAGPGEARALFDASSFREFAEGPLPAADLLGLLSTVTWGDLDGRAKRRYPSGGGFYPVQVYVYIAPGAVDGTDPGLYYLHPAERALIALAPEARYGTDLHVFHNRALVSGSAFGVFLVSTPAAIAPAYGERNAARFSTVEAGHIAQLLLTGAPERGLGLCAVGEMDFDAIRGDFGLDGDQELLLSLWGGGLTAEARARRASLMTAGPSPAPAEPEDTPRAASKRAAAKRDGAQRAVAVVGFAADLPGARTPAEFDALLARAGTATGPVPAERWAPLRSRAQRAGAAVGGYLDDVLAAERDEFGLDAAVDPQERLLLSVVRRCLEDAAVTPARLAAQGPVGVFVGSMWHDHALYGVAARAGDDAGGSTHATRGGLAHRTSHAFGLTGPSVLLDSGCVSGLAAVEAAYRAVADGRCPAALAAATNLVLHPDHLDVLSEMGLVAEDAASCAFTDRASGWLVGEGVGAVLLKPLDRALADGDPVHAVLRGGALQHSGTTRQFGIPDPQRQEQTMRAALADAGLEPADIGYVEAAAAGAALADALEYTALGRLFGEDTAAADAAGPVPVGTVKPNTGHLEAASVFAQLAKVVAQFRREKLYPTLLTSAVNPALARSSGAVALAGPGADDWRTAPGRPRRVLVNGFAGGGSYGSLVVEEPPAAVTDPEGEAVHALPLSADTPANLAALAGLLADALERDPAPGIGPVARALREGRPDRPARAVLVTDRRRAVAGLRALAERVRDEGAGIIEVTAAAPATELSPVTPWLAGAAATWPPLDTPRACLPPTPLTRVTLPLPAPRTPYGPAPVPGGDAAGTATPRPDGPGPAGLSARLERVWGLTPDPHPLPDPHPTPAPQATPAPHPAHAPHAAPAPAPEAVTPHHSAPAQDSTPAPDSAPAHHSAPAPDSVPVHDSAFRRLAVVVAAETGADPAGLAPDHDLFQLGATSKQLLRIAARVAADGGRELPLEVLFTAADLGALAEAAYPAHPTATTV